MTRTETGSGAPSAMLADRLSPIPATGHGEPERRNPGPLGYLLAGGLYLVLSVGMWWHVWTNRPSTVMTCACTDAGRMVWYLEWSRFALAHGHSLLFSDWLFHPVGFNLLSDTSAVAIALVMSPVTHLFGPVTAINVASTLIPALVALSMYWLLLRWVRWGPAAFVGGLAYGFSALVIVQLAFGWLNLACLALLPLMVGCFDELYIRQRARPVLVGAALALLVTVEFFVSTEMVLIVSVSALMATVMLAGYAGLHHRGELRRRARHALVGIGAAVAGTLVLLAYPVWFALAGPAHLSGMVWSTNVPGNLGNSIGNLWNTQGQWGPISSGVLAREAAALGGYRGAPTPSPSYLGAGILLVVAAGTLWWRSDRRLWFFGSLGVVGAVLSLRVGGGRWGPWAVVTHLPLFDDVVQSRFAAVFGLCAAAMTAIIADRSRSEAIGWLTPAAFDRRPATGNRQPATAERRTRWTAGAVAVAVSLVALVPVAIALAPNLPLTVQPVVVPRWFLTAADQLPPGRVLLTYPFATADSQASIPWQAIGGMRYQMAGGGGPAGTVARSGADRVGFSVLRAASVPLLPAPDPSASNLEAVREAMRNWGVTTVVVPDDAGLPAYQAARGTGFGVAFFTAVLGKEPAYQDHAWVWSDAQHSPPPLPLSPANLSACTDPPEGASGDGAARCVLSASGRVDPHG
jgi:hypothetical protein